MKITNAGMKALTVEVEQDEIRAVGTYRLEYLKGSKEKMAWGLKYGVDGRMWNVVSPRLPGYDYSAGGQPTFTIEGLKERGII